MCGCLTQVAPQLGRRIWIIGSCAGALEFHLPDKAWCFPLFLLFCPEEQVFFYVFLAFRLFSGGGGNIGLIYLARGPVFEFLPVRKLLSGYLMRVSE